MDCHQLASRRMQHLTAGPSHRCSAMPPAMARHPRQPAPRSAPSPHQPAPSRRSFPAQSTVVCRADGKTLTPSPLFDEVAEEAGFRYISRDTTEPNYDDPDWMDKVEDWWEFWNHTNWEIEVEDLETEEGIMAGPDESLRRAQKLIDTFTKMDMRTDIINWIGTDHSEDMFEEDKYLNPPMKPVVADPNPPLSLCDLRAKAEKRRQQELIDMEWRRRQSEIGRLIYPHMDDDRDVRVREARDQEEEYRWAWVG